MSRNGKSLLNGLHEERRSLERLNTQTDQVFSQLEKRWQTLQTSCDIDAAALKNRWLQTVSRFLEYQSSLDRLGDALGDRIGALEQTEDSTESSVEI